MRLPAARPPVESDAPVLRAPRPRPAPRLLRGGGRCRCRRPLRHGEILSAARLPDRHRRRRPLRLGRRSRWREELPRRESRGGARRHLAGAVVVVDGAPEQAEPEAAVPGVEDGRARRARVLRRRYIEIQHHLRSGARRSEKPPPSSSSSSLNSPASQSATTHTSCSGRDSRPALELDRQARPIDVRLRLYGAGAGAAQTR